MSTSRALARRANGRDRGHTKPSNPKDVIGSRKLDMGLVPDTVAVFAALGFLEGALKYGRYNWRYAGVRASIYHAALKRHLAKWWNGELADPKTKVPHLASIIACAAIILDAELVGKLTDDRPPKNLRLAKFIDESDSLTAHLRELFKKHNPYQYTIVDDPDELPPRIRRRLFKKRRR